ncbi:Uncharacterised protein [Enterobacter hormaechei]|nr:Uncharacterised protein [Enterobacter hormaechei]CZY46623.1 Uncharacterised protein [Enterobacter hormaechei]SAE03599.1 Uncharacterised protein [Enterobacter hormaechei]SAE68730.1 Uncharacterised protein [Enterobacter hormaechei]STP60602.1 Uncharacterised protein [Enterobacter hormaechei]
MARATQAIFDIKSLQEYPGNAGDTASPIIFSSSGIRNAMWLKDYLQ